MINYKYQIAKALPPLTKNNSIIRTNLNTGEIACFPMNIDNRDYQEYLQWIEEGNTPEEYNPDNIDNGTE